jgi:hypothetical protein
VEWFCRHRRKKERPRATVQHVAPRPLSVEDYIPDAAAALDIDPRALQVLTKPSKVRTLPVRLRLLGYHHIYVQSHERARSLERNDRAFDYIRRLI